MKSLFKDFILAILMFSFIFALFAAAIWATHTGCDKEPIVKEYAKVDNCTTYEIYKENCGAGDPIYVTKCPSKVTTSNAIHHVPTGSEVHQTETIVK